MLFIAKCVLTLFSLPLVEAIKGESIILPSTRECKMRAQEKHTSFVDFVRSNAEAAALQPQ